MGWAEDQAARAREQQRQADQRAASARQAESIRLENETRNREQRKRANDEMFAANAQRDKERQAREKAVSDKRHTDFMAQARRAAPIAESVPSWSPSPRRTVAEPVSNAVGSYPVKKKSKGVWIFLFLIVGIIYAVGHSGSNSSGSSSKSITPAPIVDGPTQPLVETKPPAGAPDTSTTQTIPVGPSRSDQSAATITTDDSKLTELPNTVRTVPTPLSAPSSNELDPLSRPGAYYPAAALRTRAQGEVIVVVGVQPDGTVSSATAASGDPVFVPAALAAARRWTFKPYPYQPGTSVRTMRIAFSFVPPADYTLPSNNGSPANYTLPANSGLGPG